MVSSLIKLAELISHSYRGGQYCLEAHQAKLKNKLMIFSMGGTGNFFGDAAMEIILSIRIRMGKTIKLLGI